MRISDCADLTGTTVRTIRYYHQIGLLPVPPAQAGRRDYGFEEIARILRIRWLVDAGLPLDSVATLLAEEDSASREPAGLSDGAGQNRVLRDLRATADNIDERIQTLQDQRHRIDALLAMAERGDDLRALAPGWQRFYDHLTNVITDPQALKVLRWEQRLTEMFAQRGLIPPATEALISRISEEDTDRIVDFYSRYALLGTLPAPDADQAVAELVADLSEWYWARVDLVQQYLRVLPGWAQHSQALTELVAFSARLTGNRRQAEVIRGVGALLHQQTDEPDEPDERDERADREGAHP